MEEQRWQRLWELFHDARKRKPSERRDFLESACAHDPDLRARVGRLLEAHQRSSGLLDRVDDEPRERAVDPLLGKQIGPYRIRDVVGEGGMGIVYDAEQLEPLKRRVALKLIRPGMDTREVVARFETERQTLALMEHPYIARVFDAGATEWGVPYVVMEYVPGKPITDHCEEHRVELRERLELFLRVCDGVQHAHQKGVIHRDLKPSNVLVSLRDGVHAPKIIDFGIAKATERELTPRTMRTSTGMWIGTPEYMSPEQADPGDRDVDTRTDIYGLGMLLYELMAGDLPFDTEWFRSGSFDEMRRRIREEEPPRPSERARRRDEARGRRLVGDLDWITMKALEKDPARRYASVAELAGDVRRHLRHEPVLAGPPGVAYRFGKFVRRHRAGVGLGLAAVLLLVAFATSMAIQAARIARERDRANEEAERARLEARTAAQVSDFLVSLFRVSDPLQGRGGDMTARQILDRGARYVERQLDEEPEVNARLLVTIGKVYGNLGLYERSAEALEKSLEVRRRLHGETHVDVVESLHALAALRLATGEYDEARSLFEQALETQDVILDPDDPSRIDALRGLSLVLQRQGEYSDAAKLQQRVLSIYESAFGPEDPRVGIAARDLGNTYVEAGDLEKARAALGRALDILEKTRGPDHADVGYVLSGLSVANWKDGRYAEARPRLERSIEILEGVYTADHPVLLGLRGNLARLIHDMGELDSARSLYERTLAAQEQRLGPEHPDLSYALGNLASLLRDSGELAESERLYRRAIHIRETKLGLSHPLLADVLDGYAELLHARGLPERAAEVEQRARAIRESRPGAEPP